MMWNSAHGSFSFYSVSFVIVKIGLAFWSAHAYFGSWEEYDPGVTFFPWYTSGVTFFPWDTSGVTFFPWDTSGVTFFPWDPVGSCVNLRAQRLSHNQPCGNESMWPNDRNILLMQRNIGSYVLHMESIRSYVPSWWPSGVTFFPWYTSGVTFFPWYTSGVTFFPWDISGATFFPWYHLGSYSSHDPLFQL